MFRSMAIFALLGIVMRDILYGRGAFHYIRLPKITSLIDRQNRVGVFLCISEEQSNFMR